MSFRPLLFPTCHEALGIPKSEHCSQLTSLLIALCLKGRLVPKSFLHAFDASGPLFKLDRLYTLQNTTTGTSYNKQTPLAQRAHKASSPRFCITRRFSLLPPKLHLPYHAPALPPPPNAKARASRNLKRLA